MSRTPNFSINNDNNPANCCVIFYIVGNLAHVNFVVGCYVLSLSLEALMMYDVIIFLIAVLGIGGFINSKKVFIQDYQHFNGNRSFSASEYVNSFQLAKYYANSTAAAFYSFGHLEHHFNGLLTNKIPLFNRLNWNLVAGSNAFYVNKNSNYVEVFAGLENIFKILRVDLVAAYANGKKGQTGIRVGTGGVIGGSIKTNSRNRSINISF